MTTWNDITRSEIPFNWKAALERVCMTPERLNNHINQLLTERKMNNFYSMSGADDEVVDMDEVSKSNEILDDTNVEDDADLEPDSDIDEDSDIDDDDTEEVEETS